jgi:hypothetical protein
LDGTALVKSTELSEGSSKIIRYTTLFHLICGAVVMDNDDTHMRYVGGDALMYIFWGHGDHRKTFARGGNNNGFWTEFLW